MNSCKIPALPRYILYRAAVKWIEVDCEYDFQNWQVKKVPQHAVYPGVPVYPHFSELNNAISFLPPVVDLQKFYEKGNRGYSLQQTFYFPVLRVVLLFRQVLLVS